MKISMFFAIFSTVFAISFLGSLPFGILNITALCFSKNQGGYFATAFSLGVSIIEFIFVLISLYCLRLINQKSTLLKLPQIVMGFLLLIFSFFIFSNSDSNISSQIEAKNVSHAFKIGLYMSVLNIFQIPFWLIWNSYIFQKKKLKYELNIFLNYSFGAAIGTFSALSIFNLIGFYNSTFFDNNYKIINICTAFFFCIFALFQIFIGLKKIIQKQN